jgi:hypothetical protein
MKLLLSVITVMLATSGFTAAQTISDTTRRVVKANREPKVLDQNGDGVRDGMQLRMQGLKRGVDRFIDANGDGICDGRENGLGFQRSAAGIGAKAGRKGQGRGK